MSLELTIIIVAACLLLESFHSGSEIAVYSADAMRVRHRAENGSRTARIALRFIENTDLLLGTTLVGTNLATVTATVVITINMVSAFGERGIFYTVLVMSPLTLIIGELIPKTIYQRHADRIILLIAYPLFFVSKIFFPIGWLLTKASGVFLSVFGLGKKTGEPLITREDLRLLIGGRTDKSDIQADEERMVQRVLEFRETTVEQAMRPLIDVHAFPDDLTVKQALSKVAEDNFTRYPIFQQRIVNITGIVTSMDLIYSPDPEALLADIQKDIMYVPEGAKIEEIFSKMRTDKNHMAIAVDEYGGAVGIITVEDILEEIVGEIEDEADLRDKPYQKINPNLYLLSARTEIDEINEDLGLKIPKGNYETVAGLLLAHLGRMPAKGARITIGRLTFIVKIATTRKIEEVYLVIDPKGKGA